MATVPCLSGEHHDTELSQHLTLAGHVHVLIVLSNSIPGTHGCVAPTTLPPWQYAYLVHPARG